MLFKAWNICNNIKQNVAWKYSPVTYLITDFRLEANAQSLDITICSSEIVIYGNYAENCYSFEEITIIKNIILITIIPWQSYFL